MKIHYKHTCKCDNESHIIHANKFLKRQPCIITKRERSPLQEMNELVNNC
jgi:hypothetical protein